MAWKLAPAVKAIFTSANAIGPNRNKASDGTIGDPAHSSRKSDHNPNRDGYVMAGDLTHDPANGIDCNTLAEMARVDARCKYVIWARRIAVGGGQWRRYDGTNPHDKHAHISVDDDARDDASPWFRPPTPQEEDDMALYVLWAEGVNENYVTGTMETKVHIKTEAAKKAILATKNSGLVKLDKATLNAIPEAR